MLGEYLHLTVITYITLISVVSDVVFECIRLIECELIFVALVAFVAFVADVAIVSKLCAGSNIHSVRPSGLVSVESHDPAPGRPRGYTPTILRVWQGDL